MKKVVSAVYPLQDRAARDLEYNTAKHGVG